MKRTIWFLAVLLGTHPAAAWEIKHTETKKTWSYVAYQADKSNAVELQFFCDETQPEEMQLLVFTDQDAQTGDDQFPDVAVSFVVDGTTFDALSGYYDNVDGERTVVIDTLEEDRVRDVLDAASKATQPLQVKYEGRGHSFAVDDVAQVLGSFIAGCAR